MSRADTRRYTGSFVTLAVKRVTTTTIGHESTEARKHARTQSPAGYVFPGARATTTELPRSPPRKGRVLPSPNNARRPRSAHDCSPNHTKSDSDDSLSLSLLPINTPPPFQPSHDATPRVFLSLVPCFGSRVSLSYRRFTRSLFFLTPASLIGYW